MLADVRRKTIQPIIEATVAKGALVHTDEGLLTFSVKR